MATIYKCDRCSDERTYPFEKMTVPATENNYRFRADKTVDLCEQCLVGIHEAVQPLPQQKKA